MKQILFLFTLLFSFTSYSQEPTPPPIGCLVLSVLDNDNDGFASFDLDAYFIQFRIDALLNGFDFSGYQIEFYPSENDFNQGTNQITISPYTNIVINEQFCYMNFIYSGTGPSYTEADFYYFSCHKLEVTSALATASQIQNLLQLYPNPVSGLLNVELNTESAFSTSIYDLNGRILMTETTSPINVSKLQNGTYLVNVTSEGKQYTQKITVTN